MYLAKPKPFVLGILYSLPDKIDFVNCTDQIFSQFNTHEIQEETPFFKGNEIFCSHCENYRNFT